jgi:hypothetical protein
MHQLAITFEDYLQIMAIESPHALILDWWGRLDLAVKEYFEIHGMAVKSSTSVRERALGADPMLGSEITIQIRELRLIRNIVTHEKRKPLSCADAALYARKAYELIWVLGRAHSY